MPISNHAVTIHRHTQSEAATDWLIQHNQGSYPIVDVYVPSDGSVQKVLPESIQYIDPNTVKVTFTIPTMGFATVVA